MNQIQYNDLDAALEIDKKRFVNAVIKKAKKVGLRPKNLLHRLAIRTIANVDYEIVMALLIEQEN